MNRYKKNFTLLITLLLTTWLTLACGREAPPTPTITSDTVAIPTRLVEDDVNGGSVTPIATSTTATSGGTPIAEVTGEITALATPLGTPTPWCVIEGDWPTYTVQSGDTLGEIATAVESTIAELTAANCIENPNLLEVGQALYVPQLPPTPQPDPTTTVLVWTDYTDVTFQVNLTRPEVWTVKNEDGATRIEGEEGFIFISAVGGGSLDALAQNEANHKLLPYGTNPTIETIRLADGQPGRLILPSDDQPAGFDNIATIIATYPRPLELNGRTYTHVMIQANEPNIQFVREALSLPGTATGEVNIRSFTAEIVEVAADGGRTVRFTWQGDGATYGRISSGTAERFMPWWEVEPSGTRTVQLGHTIFPDPVMTLSLFNETTGAEATAQVQLEWPCQYSYFFSPAPERCPSNAVQATSGAYQSFENGFMIWRPDGTTNYIHVFYDDGTVELFVDSWATGQAENDPSLTPPSGLFQPVRGFGKVWRERAGVRDKLGWATAAETIYTLNYQGEWRESLPGVSYVTRPNGNLIKITDTRWEPL